MRFLDSEKAVTLTKRLSLTASVFALTACGITGGSDRPVSAVATAHQANGPQTNGPQADYPVIVGDSYEVDGVSYTPADVLNYDEVGYLTTMEAMGFVGSHHTLPVPSYVEVTSLESGRTILVRIEQRGPMGSNHLLALSPAALTQMDAGPETPVRVRRVNPPEQQRALLRDDQAAPSRMDTPQGLVNVLRRGLPSPGITPDGEAELAALPSVPVAEVSAQADMPMPTQMAELEPIEASDTDEPELIFENLLETVTEVAQAEVPEEQPEVEAQPIEGGFVVQAATFSTRERADGVADTLEGFVMPSGQYFRVRTGPFTTRAQAEASLANVREAGYTDARIYSNG